MESLEQIAYSLDNTYVMLRQQYISMVNVPLCNVLYNTVSVWQTVRCACQRPRSSNNELPAQTHPRTEARPLSKQTRVPTPRDIGRLSLEIKTTLEEMGLSDVAEQLHTDILLSDPILSPMLNHTSDLQWVSAESFFQNKHGFREEDMQLVNYQGPSAQRSKVHMPSPFTQRLISHAPLRNPYVIQQRGFKTKNASTKRSSVFGQAKKGFPQQTAESEHTQDTEGFEALLASNRKEGSWLKEKASLSERLDKLALVIEQHLKNEKNYWTMFKTSIKWCALIICLLWAGYYFGVRIERTGAGALTKLISGPEFESKKSTARFSNVKGCDEAKEELEDIVKYLKDPEVFIQIGARLPKGCLLVGPPGTGKTLLAKAVSGEAGVPFFSTSGSEFDEIFVGMGSKKIRELFQKARENKPCVVFIDEIDSVGGKRTSSTLHPYANQTVNQLLAEMDGFDTGSGIIVIGATNRVENLDKALLRAGRFDVSINVSMPDRKGRREILDHYLSKVKHERMDTERVVKLTQGFSGADIENLVNQAALRATKLRDTHVIAAHLEWAVDKIKMGSEKKHKIPDQKTVETTAYHEAGHALAAYYTKGATGLYKVTILPRGSSLGHTSFVPESETQEYSITKNNLKAQLDTAMGGRVAEELIYGIDEVTTGASSDMKMATSVAEQMVYQHGMSGLGMRQLGSRDPRVMSQKTLEEGDAEVKRLIEESYERVKLLLKHHSAEHHLLSKALLEFETLDKSEVEQLLKDGNMTRIHEQRRKKAHELSLRQKENAQLAAVKRKLDPAHAQTPVTPDIQDKAPEPEGPANC